MLGGSGTGSDVTIGGDSGISLVDPADSGLSLEEPIGLVAGGEESLELGEDDMLAAMGEAPMLTRCGEDRRRLPADPAGGSGDAESRRAARR